MTFYKDQLFLHGYFVHPRDVDDAHDAPPVAPPATPTPPRTDASTTLRSTTMNLFKSLMYLGGLESVSSRIDEPDDDFGPTYGNRAAAERRFGRAPVPPPAGDRAGRVDRFGRDACAAGACC